MNTGNRRECVRRVVRRYQWSKKIKNLFKITHMFAYVYIHVSLKGRDVYHHILYAKSMVGNTNKDLLYRTTRKYFSRGKKKCRHILRRHILGIKYIGQERTTRKFSKVWEVTRFVTTFLFDKVLSRKRIRSYSSREHSQ